MLESKPTITTLVVDLDNTLFDWFEMWGAAFSAQLDIVMKKSGVPREQLIKEIRALHQLHGTSEYAFLLQNIPSLQQLHPEKDIKAEYADAIAAYKEARARTLHLFPGVMEALVAIKAAGCQIVGYTESQSFYSAYRVRTLGLDGVLDHLFTPPDHDRPDEVERSKPASEYGLKKTAHHHTPKGEVKPNPHILGVILEKTGADRSATAYLGDSLMKDIAMAQEAGVIDLHAKYGEAQNRPEYALLREVSHWTQEDVERERALSQRPTVFATHTLAASILEIFDHVSFRGGDGITQKDRLTATVEIWKKTVAVQEHFNDLSLRIRNFGITVLGGALGAAGLIYKDAPSSYVPGALVFVAAMLCLGFYFMDAYWYHRLLKGSVDAGEPLEDVLTRVFRVPVSLGREISRQSAVTRADLPWFFKLPWAKNEVVRSKDKVNLFWRVVLVVEIAFALVLLSLAYLTRSASAEQSREKIQGAVPAAGVPSAPASPRADSGLIARDTGANRPSIRPSSPPAPLPVRP